MSQNRLAEPLLKKITITDQLEFRCAYGAPWRVAGAQSLAHEIPHHIVVKGRTVLEEPRPGRPGI